MHLPITHNVVGKDMTSGLRNQPFTYPCDNVDAILEFSGIQYVRGRAHVM